jgi:hypothetical protein
MAPMSGLPPAEPEGERVRDLRRAALAVLIGSLCVGALIAIVAIVSGGDIDETTAKVMATVAALTVYSLVGLAGGSLSGRRPEMALLGNAGIVIAGIALLITVAEIWAGLDDDDEGAWQAITISLVVSLGAAQVCLLLRRSPRDDASATGIVRVATVAIVVLLVALLTVEIATEDEVVGAQALAIIGVLWLLGTILVPLMSLLARLGRGG